MRYNRRFPIPTYIARDFYEYWRRYVSDTKEWKGITIRKHHSLLKECNTIIMDHVIEEGKDFVMPFELGRIVARKQKIDFNNTLIIKNHIDKYLSKKYGKTIYNLHDNTNGYFSFLKWKLNKRVDILVSYYSIQFLISWKKKMRTLFDNRKIDYNIHKIKYDVGYHKFYKHTGDLCESNV